MPAFVVPAHISRSGTGGTRAPRADSLAGRIIALLAEAQADPSLQDCLPDRQVSAAILAASVPPKPGKTAVPKGCETPEQALQRQHQAEVGSLLATGRFDSWLAKVAPGRWVIRPALAAPVAPVAPVAPEVPAAPAAVEAPAAPVARRSRRARSEGA